VIAFSKDEVQDVTWRYSKDHQETKRRRNLVRPRWLIKNLLEQTKKKQQGLSEDEVSQLTQRRLVECLEMLTARSVGEADRIGRQTGSLAWRLARGELGQRESAEYVFLPSEDEIEKGVMEVEFDCAEDKYFGTGRKLVKEGFLSGVSSSNNVARKVESDWNKVYVARMEGNCDKGEVTWKFRMREGIEVGKVKLMVGSSCYESGVVTWQLCSDSCCLLPAAGQELETEQLSGNKEIQLSARLVGGEGETAWQHTQLFRCPRDGAGDAPQMKISIWMKKSGL